MPLLEEYNDNTYMDDAIVMSLKEEKKIELARYMGHLNIDSSFGNYVRCNAGTFWVGLQHPIQSEVFLSQGVEMWCLAPNSDSTFDEIEFVTVDKEIKKLEDLYCIKDFPSVRDFLEKNTQLIELLEDVRYKISEIFKKHVKAVNLERFDDYEDEFSSIYIEVDTDLSIDMELDLLDKFDFEYWLAKDADVRKIINVTV